MTDRQRAQHISNLLSLVRNLMMDMEPGPFKNIVDDLDDDDRITTTIIYLDAELEQN